MLTTNDASPHKHLPPLNAAITPLYTARMNLLLFREAHPTEAKDQLLNLAIEQMEEGLHLLEERFR
jgi:hypothetical protein